MDREIAMLPETQHRVRLFHLCKDLQRERDEAKALYQGLSARIEIIKRTCYDEDPDNPRLPEQAIAPCSRCRGFVGVDLCCGLCGTKVCDACLEPSDSSHECDPATVQTVALLRADTKPCPNCATPIHKISGCDQMWCTACRTPFSWESGKIERGTIHNPHYFEYLRVHRRGAAGRPIDVPALRRTLGKIDPDHPDKNYQYRKHVLVQAAEILNHVVLETLDRKLTPPPESATILLRIQYMTGAIDAKEWQHKLQQLEKRRERVQAFRDVYELLADVAGDAFARLVSTRESAKEIVAELAGLFDYVCTCLQSVAEQFKCAVPYSLRTVDAMIQIARSKVKSRKRKCM